MRQEWRSPSVGHERPTRSGLNPPFLGGHRVPAGADGLGDPLGDGPRADVEFAAGGGHELDPLAGRQPGTQLRPLGGGQARHLDLDHAPILRAFCARRCEKGLCVSRLCHMGTPLNDDAPSA